MGIDIRKEKKVIIDQLTLLKEKFESIEQKYQIDLSDLITKIDKAIDNIKNNFFSIAFFGAFADGKSTILSVLLNRFDINISPGPTTDKIEIYKYGDYQIVDTPGLFSENLIHDERTKQYISEANVVIYTVDPVNPLKESHLPIVKWILNDLKKYDSTIFVINKMDEVADLEDEEDYEKNSIIKKRVVKRIIKEITGKEDFDQIVCISADPYGLGLEVWKDNPDYKRLSRIDHLEKVLNNFIEIYKSELMVKAGLSVIYDTSSQVVNELDNITKKLSFQLDILNNQIKEYRDQLNILKDDIRRSYHNIKEEFISLRDNIVLAINATSDMEELNSVLLKELGKDGYILQEKIDLIINTYTNNLLNESKMMIQSLEESLHFHENIYNELFDSLSETGKSIMSSILLKFPTRNIADVVIKTRDLLNLPFKFKPWGALKVAQYIKALPVIMEFLETGIKIMQKIQLDKKRKEIIDEVESFFKNLNQNFTMQSYIDNCFPFFKDIKNILEELEKNKRNIQKTIEDIDILKSDISRIINKTY